MGAAAHLDITGAKGGESKPKTPVEAPDSLQSTNIAKILLAVGEGEFDGTPTDRDIYLDNTPIVDASGNVNFPGVKWEWRPGTVEQEYIQGIPAVENETTVGVELRSDNPFSRALSDTQLSAVRVRMSWPRLAQQDANGNTNGYRIEYAIDIATDGGPYVEAHRGAVDGKTTNGYQRSVRVNLPKATSGWMLRVRRITPNANKGTIADTMTIAGYTEIIDEKLRYPNTALLYIEFDAQQFQNIPAVTVKCKAKRWPVPSNYDPIARTYTGVWDGTFKQAWTNNPAFVTYGLCVEDRFGLGKRIKSWMVDKWEMYRIAQYCDQQVPDGVGGMEPRFLCDMNLQGRAEAWVLLRDLSAIYRGMVYWAHGSLFMQADMPRTQDIDYVFTRANVIDGDFVYGGAQRSTHYSRSLVSYDNPANNYDTDVIPSTDNALQRRYRDRPIEISAIGCTRASEAQRRGKWALLSNSQDRTVTFKTGMEGRIPLPGYVIPVADELVAGRPNGGRISAAAGRVVTLDRDTPIKAGDRLILNLPNGSAQARTVESVEGRSVTVTTAYSVQPEPQLQWAIDYDDLAIQLFRVLKTTRTQEGDYEITALEFNPSKFAAIDTGAKLDERPISVIPVTTVQPPASVTLTSSHMIDQGIAVSTMTIAWPAVEGAVGYDVEWRKDNGNWVRLQRTGATSVDVTGIYAGAYLARVRSVSAFDITSIWKSSMLTQLSGKEGLPPAVTFLTTESLIFGIGLKWGFPQGAEDTQRTELWYSEGTDLAAATKLADLAYPQCEHVMQGLRGGQRFFFWARLVDRSGNIGPWFPADGTLVSGMASMDAGPILEQIKDQITESELGKELTSKIELIDGNGPGSVNERVGTAKTELAKQISEVNNALSSTKSNLQQQITSVGQSVADAKAELQQQITAVSTLAGSLPYRKDKTYSINQSALGSDGKLYQALKAVPLNTPPPNATYWTDVGQAVVTANGIAARVSKVETDVSTLDGKTTAQASKLDGLQSSLNATNDTVAKKADATVVNGLSTRVGEAEGKLTAQSTRMDGMQTSINGKATSEALQQVTSRVTATEQKDTAQDQQLTSQSQALTSLTDTVSKKAEASTVQALSNDVKQQGQNLTAQGQALTRIDTALPGVGGENFLYNPSLDKGSDALPTNPDGWSVATIGATGLSSSLVGSSLDPSGKALRCTMTLADSNAFVDLTAVADKRPAAAPGQVFTLSGSFRSTSGIIARLYFQWCNAAGAVISTDPASPDFPGSESWQRFSWASGAAPAGTVAIRVIYRFHGARSGASITGYAEWDRLQIESGSTMTGWRDNGRINTDAAAANAQATTALTGRVEKTEQGLTSASSQVTGLSNSLTVTNSNVDKAQKTAQDASTLAATKADASAVAALNNQVSNAEGLLRTQGSDITQLKNSIGSAQPFVAGMSWEFTGSTRGWVATNAGASFTAGPLFGTASKSPSIQASAFPSIAGTQNPYLRIRLRRRNTSRSAASIYWANEDGGLADSRTLGWTINIATTDWQDIEVDLSGHAGWTGKNITSMRLDMMNSADTSGEVDIAYIAVGRRSAAASAQAVSGLISEVTQQGGNLSSVAERTTSLEGRLTATNQNVTVAQQAAQAAATTAGAKGEVIFGSTTPAADKRLAQNLWIDTTDNAFTPKRWTGNAWVSVTDKVATEAAAAAQAALNQLSTKADASAVQSLTTRVSDAEGEVITQGQSIVSLENGLTTTNGNVTKAQKTAQDASDAAANALTQVATKASASSVDALTQRVTSTEQGLTSQGSQVTQLKNAIAGVQPFVAGMSWEFTGSTRGWVATNTGASFTAGPLFGTALKSPSIQANSLPGISGSQNPYMRIRLRRRNTSRSGASMYWANEDGGLAAARMFSWSIDLTTTDWQDIELDLSGHAGWTGKSITSIRLDMMNSADTSGEIDIAYIAVGRRSAAASAQALSSMESEVSQQGSKLTAETKRIDGLYASVDSANAAVQSEAKTRADAVSAIGKRVDTVQSNLGSTNAAVQQIGTAQTNLDGKVNATWSVKLGLTSGGNYYAAGFGLGLENQGGTFQSSFVVLANQFAVMNPVGEGLVSVFAAENGQVVIADALISKLSVQKAMVGSSIVSQSLAANGQPALSIDFNAGQQTFQSKTKNGNYMIQRDNGIFLVSGGVVMVEMSLD